DLFATLARLVDGPSRDPLCGPARAWHSTRLSRSSGRSRRCARMRRRASMSARRHGRSNCSPNNLPGCVLLRGGCPREGRPMSAELPAETNSLVPLNDVAPAAVRWLWRGWVPLGKVTVLDGDAGLGKSTLLLDLAARVSTGAEMPDGTPGPRAGVVVVSAEDGLGDTIRPRLEAAGADLRRVR